MGTMFPNKIALKDDLKFDLAAPAGWEYAPGDTIIGNLMRKNPLVTPEATVRIWFAGRVRAKISRDSERRDSSNKTYSATWDLFDNGQDVLYHGPLHIPENSSEPECWPISVQIPTTVSPSVTRGHKQAMSFLPLDEAPPYLPGTFRASGRDHIVSSECIVEYAVHARLNYLHRGAHRVLYATLPIMLRHPMDQNTSTFLGESKELRNGCVFKIQTQRLLPGMEDVALSLGQRTRKIFRSSKVPEFWYEIVMTTPTAVQLNNPELIPIIFNFVHREDKTSEGIKDHPQKIQINWIRLRLHCITACMAPSNFRENHPQSDQQTAIIDLHLEKVFEQLESPLVIYSSGKGSQPIHLGNMFQINLRADGLYSGNMRLVRWPSLNSIYPDFVTYSIKHTHALEYIVNLTIAGEGETIKFKPKSLVILAAL
ncbi:hypothetical protein N7532_004197 [Penicillium argentinense]|uniref:Arrestin-like N-terminal domain-containing protein n=1 Tax=Penicillium argentinense TaxID=1131581 RepID=A0A9W9FP11_9EURO|nr:uncharacterized protein N7532_004197 [Penicillium argentinense]KAJ5103668.1 hypothetical protein N7532_004197 [Penicillium argentinense]